MARRIAAPRSDARSTHGDGPIIPGNDRMPPPVELRDCERTIWLSITARLPGDWFTADTAPLLKQLCRHVALADELAAEMEELRQELRVLRENPEPDAKRMDAVKKEMRVVTRLHGFESDRIANTATKLRLTNQSRYRAETAQDQSDGRASSPVKPWNDWTQ
jgi:uncharacterized protein with von Willebrand factor type A (vWA) domain